jgi:hypothetical protein
MRDYEKQACSAVDSGWPHEPVVKDLLSTYLI